MDFHTLSRRELQVLCKKNKIAANMTNVAMADALTALQHVEGLEEFLNPSEPTNAMQSPEKAPPETPAVPRTATRASARAKPAKDPDSSLAMSRARRSAMSSRHVADQENKQVNLPDTPAVPITGKRAGLASARRRQEAMKRDEKTEEENQVVPKSSTVKSTQRKARVSAAPRVYSTRRSVRLLEKSMSELKLSEERASEVEPIKMDDLGLKEESEEVLEETEENKNTLDADADSQAAEEESSEKPDHSNIHVEKSTGMEEKERELESHVNVNVESSCVGDLSSQVLLEVECGKSDCLSALSDSDLKDDVLDEKSDQLDDNLLVSKLNQDAPPVDTSDLKDDVLDEKSDQLDDNLLVSKLNQDAPPLDTSVQTDGHNAFTEIEDHLVEETTNLEVSEELAFGEDNQSDDIDIDVKPMTEEKLLNENILEFEEDGNNEETVKNGLMNSLLPEEQNSHQQMVENNEGVGISETIICTSDDSAKLVPHIMTNSDRLVPHCDDIQEPVGDNDSGVEIPMSSQLEIWDSAPVEQEESIKLDQLMSPCLVSPIIQTEKHEDEQLAEVDLIESEEFAMEVREWHKSLVEASAAANSSEVNAADIQGYADLQELVDLHVMPEMEFVEGTCELPPSDIADKTPIFVSKISTRSPLAANGKVTLSLLTADRLPKSPVLAKSSSKKQSTVRKMANKLDNNKENMDSPRSPLAVADDQLLLELPGQVKSSSKKQPAPRKMTTLLGDDKENMQKSGRKVEPNTEKAKKKSDEGKSRDEDRVLESLQKKSLRQLKKMFKERSGMPETERKKDATEQQQLGSARPALRVLSSENQMALSEGEGN
ncbi:titin homolog isoform X2 [Rhodamnia argentea]|uniref:Titin homolog isoform X2 n=1 Tax=Rhodamnia argentea TaxID=178133 RepID=A0A8B8Q7I5_9MYRT|nr:titin homolog isoform X2 [Rhodamnia argentea]